jgi:hypothetical protein
VPTFVAMYLVGVVYAVVLGVQVQGEPYQTLIQRFTDVVGAWPGTVPRLLFIFGAAAWVARRARAAPAALQGALVGVVVAVVGLAVGGSLGIARLP